MTAPAASHKTVLVVDDDKLILEMMRDILTSKDFKLLTAMSGDEALAVLAKEPVTAVLCDHLMPGRSGVQVLEECMKLQPKAVRVLITASQNIQDVRDAVNLARVHRVVVKPFRNLEVEGIVRGAIREAELERQNEWLVEELQQALAKLQERERELEHELQVRTAELKEVMDRFLKK